MTTPNSPDPHSAPDLYMTSFSAETRKELSAEDSEAWNAIVTLLLGIICTGVLLAVVCVFLTSRSAPW